MLKLFGSAWIFRVGVISEGGGRQQGHRPNLAHNPWVGVGSVPTGALSSAQVDSSS